MKTCSIDGCDRPHYAHSYCSMHWQRVKRGNSIGGAEPLRNAPGEGTLDANGYRVITPTGWGHTCLEHRYVMEQHLRRKLFPGENVHHINGNRSDNRLENLELWTTHQPSGQRVEDKIRWAKEFLLQYNETL